MAATTKNKPALWKVVWVICPLTYLIAIALFALVGFIADQAGGKTTVIIDGQPVVTVTDAWFHYDWYQAVAVQTIAMTHAAFCLALIVRYRKNTQQTWFTFFAIAAALVYVTYVGYFTYRLFYPDPRFHPIVDSFH